jgi:GNAT superfamily N-acetyltransferase
MARGGPGIVVPTRSGATGQQAGSGVTRALVPLSMTTIGALPDRCRGCVAWELEADAIAPTVLMGDAEFEKEVWLSGVMLTWGSAGQIVTVDDVPVGFALFAPPTAVPGAAAFPTSPVSPDAVLLTTARILPEYTGQGLARYLLNGVVSALTRRGVRAIEVFGREEPLPDADLPADTVRGTDLAAAARALDEAALEAEEGNAGIPQCLLPAGFARAVGFVDVAPHHRYPRLRFELGRDIGWKAEVESALEKLFTVISVPNSPSPVERELVPQP